MPEPTGTASGLTSSDVVASQAAAATTAAQSAQTAATQAAANAAAAQAVTQAQSQADISEAEAYTLNMKKLIADELDHAANLRTTAVRRDRNAEDYDQTLRNLAQQSLQAAVNLQARINVDSLDHKARIQNYSETGLGQTTRHTDLAVDRQWNVDEVAELVAKTPVFLDAISGAVAAGVAKAIAEQPPKA